MWIKLSLVWSPLLVNVSWLCPIDPWVPELAKNHRVDRGSYRVHAHTALLLTGLNPRRVFFPYGHVKVPETHQFPEPMMQTLLGAAIVERKVQRWTGATAALFTAVCVCCCCTSGKQRHGEQPFDWLLWGETGPSHSADRWPQLTVLRVRATQQSSRLF